MSFSFLYNVVSDNNSVQNFPRPHPGIYVGVVFSDDADYYKTMLLFTGMCSWGWLRLFFGITVCNFLQMFFLTCFSFAECFDLCFSWSYSRKKNLEKASVLGLRCFVTKTCL